MVEMKTAQNKGLSESEVLASRKINGDNNLKRQRGPSFLRRFCSNLSDPVIKILLFALALNVVLMFKHTDWFETVGIGVSILLATLISTASEYGSDAAFRKLSEECDKYLCRVRRDGEIRSIPVGEVVVGDVLTVSAGEMIAADGHLILGKVLVDQAAMTGESAEALKRPSEKRGNDPSDPDTLFRGCLVLGGEGEMVVSAVGERTFIGSISREVQAQTRESPLRVRLSRLAAQISKLGYASAALVMLAYLFGAFVADGGFSYAAIMERISDVPYLVKTLLGAFTLGISVVVMAVPEGLPMMIAVVLSSNIKRMTKDNVLVRKPVGIEAAGSMNILFTDKTGTLTEGRLSVKELIFADSGDGVKASRLAQYSRTCAELCSLQAVYNTTATLVPSRGGRKSALGGNSTERAMLESLGAGAPVEFEVSWRLPFDSASKFSAVRLVKKKGVTLIKGAPEKLMGYIRNAYTRTGVAAFDRYAFEKRTTHCMSQGRRVILLAESDEGDMEKIKLGQLGTLTLVCAVVLSDRPREDARRSVEALHSAGIQVVMITGDSRDTATAIAGELSLLREGGLVLESSQLAQLSDGELEKILPRLCVVARALPSDKSRLVKISERMGLVVGMTGDGINDAPALRHADVGFAMGSGTQVAKDASDVIILDNALSSIVKAVLYGRNIFKSIRKFICLQLMMNFCAVGISMTGPFIGIDAPVTVVQMLWINIIMDTLGGLAFAGEAVSRECMKERPKRRDEPILNGYMINQIVVQGAFTVGLYLVFLCSDRIRGLFRAADDDIYVLTAFFALFIFSSVFNCFNARSDRLWLFSGIGKNKTFIFIMCAVLEIQIMFIYLGGDVLRTAPLTPRELGITMLLALSVFPADFLRKTILRAMKKREGY